MSKAKALFLKLENFIFQSKQLLPGWKTVNRLWVLLALFLGCAPFTVIERVSSQSRMPGVSSGEWFRYNVLFSWSSDDPNATFPTELEKLKDTEWYQWEVQTVTGSYIRLMVTWHFKNGTEEVHYGSVDVQDGSQDGDTYLSGLIIATNLTAGDAWYYGSDAKINETIVRTYLGESRETNFLSFNITNTAGYLYYYGEIYCDRTTGSFIQWRIESPRTYGEELSYGLEIMESNVWVIPEISSYLILPSFMFVTLLAAIVFNRRRPRDFGSKQNWKRQ